jgi:hypothetical protein
MSIRLGLNISVSPRSLFAAFTAPAIAKLLFSNDEPGVFYDFDDWSTLFQDEAGTQPVTAANQGVALALDKSGNDNHATQATTAARPLTVIHPDGGVRNLLDRSEEFDDAVWAKQGLGAGTAPVVTSNAALAPDGTMTAERVVFTLPSGATVSDISQLVQSFTFGDANYAGSFYIKSNTGADQNIVLLIRNIQVATVTATTEWQRVSALSLASAVASNFGLRARGTFTAGTVDLLVWGAQLELGSTATPYQKRVNFLDVTEAGKRSIRRLYFNGTSHFMTTPTITPNTDKAQVFAGVRKLSDAAAGAIAELGPNYNTNPPAFFLVASSGGSANYAWRASGTFSTNTGATQNSTPFVAPISNVVTGLTALTGVNTDHIFRVDGAQNYVGISGVTGTAFINQAIFIGARGGTSVFFNGYIDQLITRFGTNLDSGAIETTEKYVSTKSPELVAASEVTWNASTDTYTQNLVGLGR